MNQEQQRIAIAEACGWKEISWSDLINPRVAIEAKHFCRDTKQFRCLWLPDYLNDLNAMHEAEKVLDPKGKDGGYEYWLRTVCHIPERESAKGRYFYRATAAQRAEAFLRTIGKWEEAK